VYRNHLKGQGWPTKHDHQLEEATPTPTPTLNRGYKFCEGLEEKGKTANCKQVSMSRNLSLCDTPIQNQ